MSSSRAVSGAAKRSAKRVAGAAVLFLAAGLPAAASAQYVVPQAPPSYGQAAISGNQRTSLRGIAGGGVSLSSVNGSCRGYAQPNPSHILSVSPGVQSVRIAGRSGIDTTLMVQMPDGRVMCDDDGGGSLNPLLDLPAVPGQWRIWVGSYSGSNTGPYDLDVMAAGGAPPIVRPGGPGPATGALFATVDMSLGARPDPMIVTGTFGGPIQASNMSSDCRGWITGPPSHIVNARTGFPNLRFVVSAQSDTTLVVRYPDGRLGCNDDGGGAANPLVEGPTGPGQIMVWVGSYSSGNSGPYQLGITTIPGIRYDNLGAGTGPIVVAPPPQVVVPPPQPTLPPVTARVDLLPRIPVTLVGPGMQPGTVAVWSPRGGPSIELGIMQIPGGGYRVYANTGGQQSTVVDVPSQVARDAVVTITQRPDSRLLVRAERAPGAGDPGQQMLMLLQMLNGAPQLAEQWAGTFSDRAPRWSR
ncbi:MAG: hypothetical protein J0L92_39800 [Deltaproteobacteria bacterium]|nr:hypothetical protein [Deltaproteobacteria bacterium]